VKPDPPPVLTADDPGQSIPEIQMSEVQDVVEIMKRRQPQIDMEPQQADQSLIPESQVYKAATLL
jgi:hypothetical protein